MRKLAIVTIAMLAAAACGENAPSELTVTDGYIRLPSPGASMAAAYLTLEGPEADRLIAAEIEGVGTTELHTVLMDEDGVMRMRPVEGYDLAAGGSVVLEPGGNHLMLMEINEPLEAGQTRTTTLRFESGAETVIELGVKEQRRGGGHSHH
ncbi:MAG: copper chaperone PCu(A)C [Pseudomonadota bacterium]